MPPHSAEPNSARPARRRLRRRQGVVCAAVVALLLAVGAAVAPLHAQVPGTAAEAGWHTRSAPGLVFRYTDADAKLAESLWPVMQADRKAIMQRLRLFPAEPLRVVLLPTEAAFRQAVGGGPLEHALGVYSGTYRTVFLRAPRTLPTGNWDVRGVLRHELAHGVIDMAVAQPVPLWLHEGLAILVSDEVSFLDEASLTMRATLGRLIPLPELLYRFPATPQGRETAYLQAASFVRFLLAQQGMNGLQRLLEGLAADQPLSVALERVYGAPLPLLEQQWAASLSDHFSWAALISWSSILAVLGIPLVLAGAARRWLQRRRRYREWQAEEAAEAAGAPVRGPTGRLRDPYLGAAGGTSGLGAPPANEPAAAEDDSPLRDPSGVRQRVQGTACSAQQRPTAGWRPARRP